MPGTVEGGRKARDKNLASDPDFYKKIGAKGGKIGTTGGFAANRELARIAGKKGGSTSRRGKAAKTIAKEKAQAEAEAAKPAADGVDYILSERGKDYYRPFKGVRKFFGRH